MVLINFTFSDWVIYIYYGGKRYEMVSYIMAKYTVPALI